MRMERELLDAESMVGQLVPEGSVFAFLAEHRDELFPDSFIADLFPSRTGRPSLPADLVGSVLAVFDDAVATQDTVTQLVAAMRKVARLVPGAAVVIERVPLRLLETR